MKVEWLVVDSSAVGSLISAESEELRVTSAVFWPMRATFLIGEPLCDLETPSWTLKFLPFVGAPNHHLCLC